MAGRVEPARLGGFGGASRASSRALVGRRDGRAGAGRRGICVEAGAAEGCAASPGGGARFHNGTLVSYSSKLRSVDMRSSSSSGIGHDMVESLRASYQNPCWAARRRVPACAASAGHRRTCDHVKTSVGVAAVPYAARFGLLTAPQVAIGLRRARQARVRAAPSFAYTPAMPPVQQRARARVRWPRDFEGGPLISSSAAVRSLPRVEGTNRVPPWFRTGRGRLRALGRRAREQAKTTTKGCPKNRDKVQDDPH